MKAPRLRDAVFRAYIQLRLGAEMAAEDGFLDDEEASEVLECADDLLEAYRDLTGDRSDPR